MTNRQIHHLNMYLVVRDFSAKHSAIIVKIPNYEAKLTILNNTIPKIQSVAEKQELNRSGLSDSKDQKRATLISLAADHARKVRAYASNSNNPILAAEADYTETELRSSSAANLKDRAQIIYDRVQTNLTALTEYGITADTQTAFLSAITAFNSNLSQPRVGATEKSQATKELADLIETANDVLDKMDIAVEVMRVSEPVFYKGYKTARRIVATSNGSLAIKGMVTDAQSEPLKGVSVTIVAEPTAPSTTSGESTSASKGKTVIKKNTASKGGFHVKDIHTGTYLATFKKPGYVDQTVTVNVTNGELTVVNVQLTKK